VPARVLTCSLTKRLVERAMSAELTEHLGYEPHQEPPGGTGNTHSVGGHLPAVFLLRPVPLDPGGAVALDRFEVTQDEAAGFRVVEHVVSRPAPASGHPRGEVDLNHRQASALERLVGPLVPKRPSSTRRRRPVSGGGAEAPSPGRTVSYCAFVPERLRCSSGF
jgi:hypothetical protein